MKPCPFCGGDTLEPVSCALGQTPGSAVRCSTCEAVGPFAPGERSYGVARTYWNERQEERTSDDGR